jgi:glycosyltransferase involved in cell wall biosynthesis
MKILIIEDAAEMGGVQHSTLNLLRESINDSGNNFMLFVPEKGLLFQEVSKLGIDVHVYGGFLSRSTSISIWNDYFRMPNIYGLWINYLNGFRNYQKLKKALILRDFRPDVILTKGMKSHIPGSRLARTLSCPVVWHMQDFITDSYFGLYRKVFSFLVRRFATGIIADGTPILQHLSRKVQRKGLVVFNGISVNKFYRPREKDILKNNLGFNSEDFLIGNVARIVPWKGQLDIVKAFMGLSRDFPNIKLLLVGSPLFGKEDYFHTIKKYIVKNGLDGKVILTGYLNNLEDVYAALDLFVYSSIEKDTCPLSLISSLSAGNPLIVGDIDGVREVVEGAPCCEFYSPGSVTDLTEKMKIFISKKKHIENNQNMPYALLKFDNSVYYQNMIQTLQMFVNF